MAAFAVMLDACVLVPAVLRDALLYPAAAGLYRPHWTDEILTEVQRTLIDRGMADAASVHRLVSHLRSRFDEAIVTGYEPLIPAMTNHPKDRHVLAAAVVAHAAVIVTSNIRDFPDHALVPHHVEAQTPDEFLTDLFDLNPHLMLSLVKTQASALRKPPLPFEFILNRLAAHAPVFVELLRAADQGAAL